MPYCVFIFVFAVQFLMLSKRWNTLSGKLLHRFERTLEHTLRISRPEIRLLLIPIDRLLDIVVVEQVDAGVRRRVALYRRTQMLDALQGEPIVSDHLVGDVDQKAQHQVGTFRQPGDSIRHIDVLYYCLLLHRVEGGRHWDGPQTEQRDNGNCVKLEVHLATGGSRMMARTGRWLDFVAFLAG